jgi:hypothetical protein
VAEVLALQFPAPHGHVVVRADDDPRRAQGVAFKVEQLLLAADAHDHDT